MNIMKHAKYVGSDPLFKNESALLLPSEIKGNVLVQFDRIGSIPLEECFMCHGWHEFPESDFEIDREDPDEVVNLVETDFGDIEKRLAAISTKLRSEGLDPKKIRIAVIGMGVSTRLAIQALRMVGEAARRVEVHDEISDFDYDQLSRRITLPKTWPMPDFLLEKNSPPPNSYYPSKKRGKGKWKKY